jgi:hypothetical protein
MWLEYIQWERFVKLAVSYYRKSDVANESWVKRRVMKPTYLSSLYWVTKPLHVSGLLVAHHQEVAMYIYVTIGMCCTS